MTRLLSMIHKEIIQILRDPRSLIMVLVGPLLYLMLFGFLGSNDVRNVPLAVWDQDRSAASRALIEAYRTSDYFTIAYDVESEAELRQLVDTGSARAGLLIPPGYANTLAAGETAQVAFVIDGSDASVAGTALAAAQSIGQSQSNAVLVQRAALSQSSGQAGEPIEVRTHVWYNPDLVSAYTMIPALIGLSLMGITTLLTANAVVREHERGTIEQLIVTPLTPAELMIAKLAPFVLIGIFETVEVIVLGVVIFGVPINGSLPLLLALSGLFLAGSLGIGLLISARARTQQEAQLSVQMLILPSIFLSGFLYPLAAMPKPLQLLSYAIPLRYFLIISRGIVVKGVGMEALWPDVLALAIFAIVIMTAAVLRFRKSLD